jgi:outer membrane protein OmpA-like peptidoglycan-associated protein
MNLGPVVNSLYDDEAPVILPDANTLYFSSNRLKSDRFDNFVCRKDSGIWSDPKQVGYPVDKNKTSVFYQVAALSNKQKPSVQNTGNKRDRSSKRDSTNTIVKKEKDNYIITFISDENSYLFLVNGTVDTDKATLSQVRITVTDNTSGQVLGYYNTDTSGRYVFVLPAGRNINITYEAPGHLFQSRNIGGGNTAGKLQRQDEIRLTTLSKGSVTILDNIFFEQNNDTITSASYRELDNLIRLLSQNQGLKVKIGPLSVNKAGKKLALARAAYVAKYLTNKGITSEKIKVTAREIRIRSSGKTNDINDVRDDERQKLVLQILKT